MLTGATGRPGRDQPRIVSCRLVSVVLPVVTDDAALHIHCLDTVLYVSTTRVSYTDTD